MFEQVEGETDEIVEVHRAAVGEGALVIGIDLKSHRGQWKGSRRTVQEVADFVRGETVVFGGTDEGHGDVRHQVGQLLAADPVTFALVHIGKEIVVQIGGVALQPGVGGFLADEVGFALVNDAEAVLQPGRGRFFADDVVRQPVQGADAVAEGHGQGEEFLDAGGEVVHRRVDQGDDEHFLLVGQRAGADDLRGEGAERVRLAGAGHGGNAHLPAGVGEDLGLGGARGEVSH